MFQEAVRKFIVTDHRFENNEWKYTIKMLIFNFFRNNENDIREITAEW